MTAKRMDRMDRREYEDPNAGSGAPLKVFSAVALFGVAFLLIYITLVTPQQGTAMGAIQNVLYGLGGNLAPVLPLALAWAGVLCVLSARGRRIALWRVIADALLFACLFSAVHIFFAETIVRERMTIQGFSNFVAKSYGFGQGGGALGALLCWPLFRTFGKWGGFFGLLLIAVLLLTITGRLGRFVRRAHGALSSARERRPVRVPKNEEQMFDEPPRERARRPEKAAPRVNRDPHSEAVIGVAPGEKPRPSRRRAARDADAAGERPARAAGPAARKPKQQDIDIETEIEAAAEAGRRRAAEQPRPARNKRPAKAAETEPEDALFAGAKALPTEDATPPARKPARAKARMEAGTLTDEDLAAMGFDVDNFDDYDRLDAESILRDKKEKGAARKGFEPDRPAAMKAAADAEQEEVPVEQKAAVQKLEQLKIQPEAYEQPDEDDEPPFDMPEEQKKPLKKIKCVTIADPVEEEEPEYFYPPIDLLAQGESYDSSDHAQKDMEKAQLLEDTLKSFGITTRLIGIAHGPAVTRFELQPAAGVKVSRITSLSDDIALNLAALSVRIEAPIPGKAAVGVEIPNDKIETVRLRDVLESSEARKHPSKIAVGLGKDNSGRYIVADIAKMPHVLIAGQTGSGKSVCINSIIASILFRASPEEVRLILIDPKVVELSIYNDIPHLICPVVTDPKKAASALDWAVAEMTTRYKKFAERGVRDIKGYNRKLEPGEKQMPQMVIIIDELADLMMVSPGEVEDSICRLAQLARACGMHLVIATQRPSVNVITGIIKANIPTRIAFSVASQVDSRTMIDHGGAEKLLGNGDMLFVPNGTNKPMRVQGAWVSDDEVHAIVEYIKSRSESTYDPDMLEHMENAVRTDAEKEEFNEEYDPRLPEAVEIVMEAGQASVSMLQRRMRVGYARAGRLIDDMAQRGIVSEADGAKPRSVLITREEFNQMFEE